MKQLLANFLLLSLSKIPQERVARDMRATFPMDVITLFNSPDWKGGPLVVLHNKLGRPPSAMLGKNYIWLLPFVKEFPSKAMANLNPPNFRLLVYILGISWD